ncbi:MAG: oxidoreductase [Alphaproteobacteria bacterium CG_4_10_14_0_2_um_filter_63_37]|nr:MAG: hypothetical protein AUJ55_12110 [Proteobacteria bacterium CG1_02_64_396]PJA25712.1 MAG: oxidoreductase [Alphaproteobacteria bacterium CG_4_10_14_0_2_um_filter_63_37]
MTPMDRFDVAIAGSGPAGCAAALALLGGGATALKVALIHRPPDPERYRIGESATPSVSSLLERLGLPGDLRPLGHLPCHGNRAVWGGGAVTEQDYLVHAQGHGWHLDRAAFDRWLLDQARMRGAVAIEGGVTEVGSLPDGGWGLRLEGGRVLAATGLIDATGRGSALATRLGAQRRRIDTLTALAQIHPAPDGHPLTHLSLIESHPLGWWYAAAIPGKRLLTAFMSDADLIHTHQLSHPENLAVLIDETEELRRMLPSDRGCAGEAVLAYPAHSGFADRVSGPGWIALGDAAIGMDPLTSSGINVALTDGIAGAQAMRQWLEGSDAGLRDHAQRLNGAVGRYLHERSHYYQQERRWAGEPFWTRRGISFAG